MDLEKRGCATSRSSDTTFETFPQFSIKATNRTCRAQDIKEEWYKIFWAENNWKWRELGRSVVSACPVLTVPEPSAYSGYREDFGLGYSWSDPGWPSSCCYMSVEITGSEVEAKCKELNAIKLMQASSSHPEMTRHEITTLIVRIFNESVWRGVELCNGSIARIYYMSER